ncbi:hypothetical protein RUND412_000988 [Rhizina undulata]
MPSHDPNRNLLEAIDGELIQPLKRALIKFRDRPSPSIPSPAATPKRASVALVIRIQPHPSYLPRGGLEKSTNGPPKTIEEFFSLPWVQYGDPECLFIKRAARKGDRWTAHVAFPGGKRDLEDAGDFEAAVRECWEEVGLDLKVDTLECGKLPDRVVTTSWGTHPLMVLCPFIFLHISPSAPALTLQPTEVASAHWVPLRALLSPTFRTVEKCDVSDRLARQATGALGRLVRYVLRISLGQMEFAAIRLWPSLSVFSNFGRDFLQGAEEAVRGRSSRDTPLLLWGLSLGVLVDFLEEMPNGDATRVWKYPTFTVQDVRFVVWAMTKSLRERNVKLAKKGSVASEVLEIREIAEKEEKEALESDTEVTGIETGVEEQLIGKKKRTSTVDVLPSGNARTSTVGVLLEGYYDIVRSAVWFTLFGRTALFAAGVGFFAWKAHK